MATVPTVSLRFTVLTTHKGTEQCGEVYCSILLLVLLCGIVRNVDMMFTFRRWKWLRGFVKSLEDLITQYRGWATQGEDGHCFCRTRYLRRSRINHRQSVAQILWFWRSWRQFCFSKRLVSPGVRRQRSQSLERARCSSVLTIIITNNHINILNLWHWDGLSRENFNPMIFTSK